MRTLPTVGFNVEKLDGFAAWSEFASLDRILSDESIYSIELSEGVQEHRLHSLGPWWSDQNASNLAALLSVTWQPILQHFAKS